MFCKFENVAIFQFVFVCKTNLYNNKKIDICFHKLREIKMLHCELIINQ